MRPRPTTAALSPKLLKHFAAATVALTCLLAVLASGADWGAQAQVDAVEAKNQLAKTEAEKLGARKVATTLKIANEVAPPSFGDGGGDFGTGGGGGYAPRQALRRPRPISSAWIAAPGPGSAPPLPDTAPPLPGQQPAPGNPSQTSAKAPSPEEIAQMTASSSQRSGAAGSSD